MVDLVARLQDLWWLCVVFLPQTSSSGQAEGKSIDITRFYSFGLQLSVGIHEQARDLVSLAWVSFVRGTSDKKYGIVRGKLLWS